MYLCVESESLCYTVETSTTLYINYISIKNKNKMTNKSVEDIKKSLNQLISGCIFCKCLVNVIKIYILFPNSALNHGSTF